MRTAEIKPLGAAAVILDERGYVLLVKHSYGKLNWELPGGLAEANESLVDTAVREVREETGLRVRVEWLTGFYYEPTNHDIHQFVFLCTKEDPAALPRPDKSEITECAYCSPDDLPRPISDFTVRRIRDATSGGSRLPLPTIIGPRQWFE
ncbi:MAG TPA: NUDIX hydrolase [Chloroflexota bacterium]|nr:NUDIX hydrolase [Chloroflexota bacterium]